MKKEIGKFDKYILKITTLEREKSKYNKEIDLEESNQEKEEINSKQKATIEEKDLKIKELAVQVETLEGTIKVIEKDRDNLKEKNKELRKSEEKAKLDALNLAAKCDTLKLDVKIANRASASSKGGFTRVINKLKIQIEEKDKKINELEEKNHNQENKIIELNKRHQHISEEYKNDGLPKQTKQALKNVISKKNELSVCSNKKMIPDNITNSIEDTVSKLEKAHNELSKLGEQIKGPIKDQTLKKDKKISRKKGFRN